VVHQVVVAVVVLVVAVDVVVVVVQVPSEVWAVRRTLCFGQPNVDPKTSPLYQLTFRSQQRPRAQPQVIALAQHVQALVLVQALVYACIHACMHACMQHAYMCVRARTHQKDLKCIIVLVPTLVLVLALLLECLLNVVGVLGFPRLPSPYSDFLRERWLMIEEETTRDLGGRVGLLVEEVLRSWRLKLEAPVVWGLEYAEWKEVLSGLGVDDWEVVGSLLFAGGGRGGISEWTVGVGSVSCSLVFPLVVCGGVLPSPWWAEPNTPPDLITLQSYSNMALKELLRGSHHIGTLPFGSSEKNVKGHKAP
jgi:hypothetical protein